MEKIVVDRGKLNPNEASLELFEWLEVKLSLIATQNLEANGKMESGHNPIIKDLVKSCVGRVGDRSTIHTTMMLIEEKITSWKIMRWEDDKPCWDQDKAAREVT